MYSSLLPWFRGITVGRFKRRVGLGLYGARNTPMLSFAEQWTIAVTTISAEFGEMDVLPGNAGDNENPPIS